MCDASRAGLRPFVGSFAAAGPAVPRIAREQIIRSKNVPNSSSAIQMRRAKSYRVSRGRLFLFGPLGSLPNAFVTFREGNRPALPAAADYLPGEGGIG